MAAASFSSPTSSSPSNSTASDRSLHHLTKQIRSHEIAVVELGSLPSSRAVYQKHGNIFFRTTVQKATANQQKQVNLAKAKLQKLNSP